eukprot:Nk52_evm13s375 gene=Nk52_evmTU13s375
MAPSLAKKLSISGSDKGTDNQARYLYQRLQVVDKGLDTIHYDIKRIVDMYKKEMEKTARLTQNIAIYADNETPGIKQAFGGISEAFGELYVHRQLHAERLQLKVMQPLHMYKKICKIAKDDLHAREGVKHKEVKKSNSLSQLQAKDPTNRTKISQAKLELAGAHSEVLHINKALLENMEQFERQKIRDLKVIFQEYIHTELAYHAKAIEAFTKAYQKIDFIDEEVDIDEFLTHLRQRQGYGSRGGSLAGDLSFRGSHSDLNAFDEM